MNIIKNYKEKRILKKIESDVGNELMKMDLLTIDSNGKKDYKMDSANIMWEIQKVY